MVYDFSFQYGDQPSTLGGVTLVVFGGIETGEKGFLYQILGNFCIADPGYGVVEEVICIEIYPILWMEFVLAHSFEVAKIVVFMQQRMAGKKLRPNFGPKPSNCCTSTTFNWLF
jgi:energy-converting hydrogenase Eha subunit B